MSKSRSIVKSMNKNSRLVIVLSIFSLSLLAPLPLLAGNLDGIEIALTIAVICLVITLACWGVALINVIRKLKRKPYSKKYLYLSQSVLIFSSLILFILYQGVPGTQIAGTLFFLLPIVIHFIGWVILKKWTYTHILLTKVTFAVSLKCDFLMRNFLCWINGKVIQTGTWKRMVKILRSRISGWLLTWSV